ncbi:hypothetical protein RB213_013540 [Colletotrichum asianum]
MFITPTWSLGTGGLVEERGVGAERLLTTFICVDDCSCYRPNLRHGDTLRDCIASHRIAFLLVTYLRPPSIHPTRKSQRITHTTHLESNSTQPKLNLLTGQPNTSRFNSHVGLASLHAPLGTQADSVYSWSLRRGTVPPSSRPALLAGLLWGLTLAASPPAPDTLPAVLSAAPHHCCHSALRCAEQSTLPPPLQTTYYYLASTVTSHKVLHAAPSLPIRPLDQRAGLPSDGD